MALRFVCPEHRQFVHYAKPIQIVDCVCIIYYVGWYWKAIIIMHSSTICEPVQIDYNLDALTGLWKYLVHNLNVFFSFTKSIFCIISKSESICFSLSRNCCYMRLLYCLYFARVFFCVCYSLISLFAIFRIFIFIRRKKINWQISTFLLLITFIEGLFFLFHLPVAIFHLEKTLALRWKI